MYVNSQVGVDELSIRVDLCLINTLGALVPMIGCGHSCPALGLVDDRRFDHKDS